MSKIETILGKLFHYRDITKVVDGQTLLYLRRYFILKTRWGSLFLHKIVRSDDDPDPHDHPWDFTSFILASGYGDQQWFWDGSTRYFHRLERVKPRTVVRRRAEHTHRVIIEPGKPAWTLVFTKNKRRPWYFVTESGPVYWREYLNDWGPNTLD